MPLRPSGDSPTLVLTERQAAVLRAVVASYVGAGAPIGSKTISHLLSVSLSAASVRNTLAELSELGLVEKSHASAGRVPTERGMRTFVDTLLSPGDLVASERREIAYQLEGTEGEGVVALASELLSRHTRQLGFVFAPRLDRMRLQHLSLVRLSTDKLLVVLISASGAAHRRVIDDLHGFDQPELDGIATLLNERVVGLTLPETRSRLEREARALRREANRLLAEALELGCRALAPAGGRLGDLVIETRLTLFEQPEFNDPRHLRDVFEALETRQRLLDVLDQVLVPAGVGVGIGEELEDPALRRCAMVAAYYGSSPPEPPLGALGVIGPSRMDFARVIPLVEYLSEAVTGKLRG